MTDNDIEIIKKFKALLLKKFTNFEVILFGSRARNDSTQYSDMDIVVILDSIKDESDIDYVSDCAWEAGFEYGIVVVPIVFSKDEWDNSPQRYSLLVQAVKSEGIVV
ncbi:MAG TPA: nucleotidyltransferase domain-containing protein [Spirochaetota bacterium]|nr:nucleotidyltransferase domain-containing protein [Spirochaetota bacterium]